MNRTTWLQDRRMQKFRDIFGRFEAKKLAALEAAEILGGAGQRLRRAKPGGMAGAGMSERTFGRYRRRYEEGGLAGVADKRVGRASARA